MRPWLASLLALLPATLASLPAKADFLVGVVAYERKDFATAYRELLATEGPS